MSWKKLTASLLKVENSISLKFDLVLLNSDSSIQGRIWGAWCRGRTPLGRQDSIISIAWYAKVRHAPPFVSLSKQTDRM